VIITRAPAAAAAAAAASNPVGYSADSVSPAGTASSESPMPPLTSMKLRRRVSSVARRRRAW
jgi:hypothetical protein